LVYQYVKKPRQVPKCGQCKNKLRGVTPARSRERSQMSRRLKMVKRSYGGVLCHKCVKERYCSRFIFSVAQYLCLFCTDTFRRVFRKEKEVQRVFLL